jgi:hypothetical protein
VILCASFITLHQSIKARALSFQQQPLSLFSVIMRPSLLLAQFLSAAHSPDTIPSTNTTSPLPPSSNSLHSLCPVTSLSTYACGARGYLTTPSHLSTVNITKISACRAACEDDPTCESFSHTVRTGPCQLYAKELQLQGLVKVSGSTTVMYNRNCFLLARNETMGLETSVSVPAVRARRAGK